MNETILSQSNIAIVFKQTAAKWPQKIAIVDNNHSFTYQEIEHLSNQLALYLQSLEVKKGDLVGICLIKSYAPIVAMLAILKIGAAYLPISTEVSPSRFQYVIDNSGCKFFLLDSVTFPKYKLQHCSIIELTSALNQLTTSAHKNKKLNCNIVNNTNAAYVMYTSGTTGKAKGVIANHAAVINLVKNPGYVDITPEDTFLQLSPLEFDGSTFEIWGALLNGACLVLMPAGWPQLEVIAKKIKQYNISIMFITTRLFNSLVDFKIDALLSVKQLYFGGEQASIPHVKKFMKMASKNKLHNIYGPTECTTFSTYHRIMPDNLNGTSIPIGKPININVKTLILSENLNLTSKNEIGELYIGGVGVSIGYLNDPTLTNEKFIDLPFSQGKFFKSGDMVRSLENGDLEFLGRTDRLIKIRGFRVYLEEVESVIKEYPDVGQAAVICIEENNEKILIACLVPKPETIINIEEFKKAFLEKNPQFMLPSKIFIFDDLPMSFAVKLDYNKISALVNNQNKANNQQISLEKISAIEREIHDIWCKELNLKTIGLDEDFFDLGGHSLKLINILEVFHTHHQYKVFHKVSMMDLFKHSTIRDLANCLEKVNE